MAFKLFCTPHTGDVIFSTITDSVLDWDLSGSMKCINSNNAVDIIAGMRKLRALLNDIYPGAFENFDKFYVRCMAHFINLAAKECMEEVHSKITKIRKLVSAICASVKRRDISKFGKIEFNLSY